MPLKHSTETWLVILLGGAVALTGVLCAFLQRLPNPSLLWAVFFAISVAYPLSLYPLFRDRRADYSFRLLHFMPAAMLLLWLLLRFAGFVLPVLATFSRGFVWGWSLSVVIPGFVALLWFCITVIRQRRQRSIFLMTLLVPFLVLALSGEHVEWSQRFSSSNLSPSSSVTEEKWRAELRRLERRRERLTLLERQPRSVTGARDGVLITGSQSSQVAMLPSKPVQDPPHLPSSGFGMEIFVPSMIAAYCATVHRRAKRRV